MHQITIAQIVIFFACWFVGCAHVQPMPPSTLVVEATAIPTRQCETTDWEGVLLVDWKASPPAVAVFATKAGRITAEALAAAEQLRPLQVTDTTTIMYDSPVCFWHREVYTVVIDPDLKRVEYRLEEVNGLTLTLGAVHGTAPDVLCAGPNGEICSDQVYQPAFNARPVGCTGEPRWPVSNCVELLSQRLASP